MSSTPDIDPYVVLGVQKDATLADIKSAHRKLVLKCHPDKIKDESQRSKAQDEFQKVQQAYELLSDETRRAKYDNKVRLAELRREMLARGGNPDGSSSRSNGTGSSGAREYRNGRVYEERTPADATNYYDDDALYTDGTRPTTRKYDDYGKRRAKVAEEKKKTKSVPLSAARAAKEMLRDNVKSTHSSRDKYRTKERKRDAYDKKYPERAAPYSESEDDGAASDSSASSYYVRVTRPSESKRNRESSTRKARPMESARRPEPARYESQEYSDLLESKHEKMHTTARDYILRSKGTVPIEIDRRARASRSPPRPHAYDSADPESSSSRRSNRSNRPSKETVRSSSSRNGSYEHVESQSRSYDTKVPSMPTAATSPAVKSSSIRPSLQTSRSASTAHSHSRPKTLSRSEQVLLNMVDGGSRATKLRTTEKYDSGYSSPGTPEMPPGESPTRRYRIVTDPEPVLVEPSMPSPHASSRHARGYSPPRQERSGTTRSMPKPPVRSSTYAYPSEYAARYESSSRPSASRQSSSRPLYGEVEYARGKDRDYKYAREIGPEHIPHSGRDAHARRMDEYPHPPIGRRQSAYAQ
ncbi:DnaJ-domain-containing protein [Aspergillus homomorphus CBS 101889]|uniref:DnaJ-domain-containing protein n=1 Tax=Aspergillus homomorphus (strain CBS 101889) TaxID=1450537 RepID=A0A395HQC2_ASPHC|nr:DnaJ-domain-containing protein [Aspergillus homomorphus CBS 101889]RAL09940.1 DnaJ-domain-containing protein [Aspergillus homomorphus CBS 101889]